MLSEYMTFASFIVVMIGVVVVLATIFTFFLIAAPRDYSPAAFDKSMSEMGSLSRAFLVAVMIGVGWLLFGPSRPVAAVHTEPVVSVAHAAPHSSAVPTKSHAAHARSRRRP